MNVSKASNVKYRRPLNGQQLDVLHWLYRFRFSTSKQIAVGIGRTEASYKGIQKKLQILEEQDIVGKRYDNSYKLAGRPAEYYLTPKGAKQLEILKPESTTPAGIKALYKNKTLSEDFLRHCIHIVDVALTLKALHGNKLLVFGNLELRKYTYFPSWTPDLFLSYKASDGTVCRAFLDVWDGSKPFFVSVRKMRHYLTDAVEGDWPTNKYDYPAVLAVCANTYDQKKLNRQMKKALSDSDDADNIPCGTTTLELLGKVQKATDKAWTSVSWANDTEVVSLVGAIATQPG